MGKPKPFQPANKKYRLTTVDSKEFNDHLRKLKKQKIPQLVGAAFRNRHFWSPKSNQSYFSGLSGHRVGNRLYGVTTTGTELHEQGHLRQVGMLLERSNIRLNAESPLGFFLEGLIVNFEGSTSYDNWEYALIRNKIAHEMKTNSVKGASIEDIHPLRIIRSLSVHFRGTDKRKVLIALLHSLKMRKALGWINRWNMLRRKNEKVPMHVVRGLGQLVDFCEYFEKNGFTLDARRKFEKIPFMTTS